MNSVSISVVVCTHNRASFLPRALDSLADQTLDPARYEILVVDNHSTDATASIVEQFRRRHPSLQITALYEPTVGLAYARNTGWRHARGGYVAFMDDDAKADQQWLARALTCFENVSPVPLVAGGPILPYYSVSKPSWFKDSYELRSWGSTPRFLKQGESFSGSNMIFRKQVLNDFGGFDIRLGMQGNRISVGEETSLFQKIVESARGLDSLALYYDPEMVVYHAVGRYKLCASYHVRRSFAVGRAWYVLHGPMGFRDQVRCLRMTLTALRQLSIAAVKAFREFPDYRNWIVECVGLVAIEFGRFVEGTRGCARALGKSLAGQKTT
jgi:glycosyltransferase involved in cell wall biosynthesis